MNIRNKELMKGILETSCEKVEKEESSQEVVIRETKEEMGLKIQPLYLVNDEFYDCNIYIYRLEDMEKLE